MTSIRRGSFAHSVLPFFVMLYALCAAVLVGLVIHGKLMAFVGLCVLWCGPIFLARKARIADVIVWLAALWFIVAPLRLSDSLIWMRLCSVAAAMCIAWCVHRLDQLHFDGKLTDVGMVLVAIGLLLFPMAPVKPVSIAHFQHYTSRSSDCAGRKGSDHAVTRLYRQDFGDELAQSLYRVGTGVFIGLGISLCSAGAAITLAGLCLRLMRGATGRPVPNERPFRRAS